MTTRSEAGCVAQPTSTLGCSWWPDNLQASVYYESTGGLRITPALGDYQILEFVVGPDFESHRTDGSLLGFKETLGLVHYVANPRLQAAELEAIHKTSDCDRAPQACVAVAGQLLPFPG